MDALASSILKGNIARMLDVIPNEDIRLKYIKKIRDSHIKSSLVATLNDDELKMEYLKSFSKEKDRVNIIASFSEDDKKLNMLPALSEYAKAEVVKALEDDNEKKRLIFSGFVRHDKIADIIQSMKDDNQKVELIKLVDSDTARARIIISLNDLELKKKLFESEIRDSRVKKRKLMEFVLSLPKSEQFSFFYDVDDKTKVQILQDCDVETMLNFLDAFEKDSSKKELLGYVPNERLLEYVTFHLTDRHTRYSQIDSLQITEDEAKRLADKKVEDIVKYGNLSAEERITCLKDYFLPTSCDDTKVLKKLLSKELLADVLRYYFGIDSGYIPVNMIDEINQIYDISGKNKLVFEIPDFWDIADTGNVEYIRKLLEKKEALLLFPVRCEVKRLKLYDNIVKGNIEKAYFDQKNRYIILDDFDVELPKQYNEIYHYMNNEKVNKHKEECVVEKTEGIQKEQIANIAIKRSLIDVPVQCVKYIQEIALELLNNQNFSSSDVKQLFASERQTVKYIRYR